VHSCLWVGAWGGGRWARWVHTPTRWAQVVKGERGRRSDDDGAASGVSLHEIAWEPQL
jgi:hypothetical protein